MENSPLNPQRQHLAQHLQVQRQVAIQIRIS
jgi:hypothetical protein